MKKSNFLPLLTIASLAVSPFQTTVFAKDKNKEAAATTPAPAEKKAAHLYASAEEAQKAFLAALDAADTEALRDMFGSDVDQVTSGDKVQTAKELADYAKIAKEGCVISKVDDNKVMLSLGSENWPFPIPLVKNKDGQWSFDTLAGRDEIVNRRVGENELTAIAICRAYVAAQRQFASVDRDGNEVCDYAQKIKSTPGKHDGLYWEAADNEEQSPFGPLIASAHEEGYGKQKEGEPAQPYHGYFFKVIKTQGSAAPGGAYNYVINGNMIGGFALLAWPDKFGQSGIMSFIVNQQGKVYQKSLGKETDAVAKVMSAYNPDKSWTLVPDDAQTTLPAQ